MQHLIGLKNNIYWTKTTTEWKFSASYEVEHHTCTFCLCWNFWSGKIIFSSYSSSPRKVCLCASSSAYLHLRQMRSYLHAVTESSWCVYLECLFHLAAHLLELENMFVPMFSNQKRISEYSTYWGSSTDEDLSTVGLWCFFWPGSLAASKDFCLTRRLRIVRPIAYIMVRIQLSWYTFIGTLNLYTWTWLPLCQRTKYTVSDLHNYLFADYLVQSIPRSLWVREVASSSPVSTNALVKIECAWNSPGQGTHC